jgi:hypothetical protein
VSFPTVSGLDHFSSFTGASVLPINALVPLTIIPETASNRPFGVTAGYFVNYDTAGLIVNAAGGALIASGANVGAPSGRLAFEVVAKTTPGTYDVTFSDAGGTITKTVTYEVVEYTEPLAVSASAETIDTGATTDITVTGGTPPYTVASADAAIATAAIIGSTVTITGVAGGTVDVTVTDAAADTAVVAVTVTAAVAPAADGFPAAAMTSVAFPATTDPTVEPVTVAAGSVALTPTMTVTDCTDVVSAIGYVYIPAANFGIAIPATVSCAAGVASFDLGTVDFTGFADVYYIYFGYIDASSVIHYNAYELTVN